MHLGALTLAFSGQVVKFLARTEKELFVIGRGFCAQITHDFIAEPNLDLEAGELPSEGY